MQSTADILKPAVHLGVMPIFMLIGALLMNRKVSVERFDEIRGKFKKHRNNMKAFTKEKLLQMDEEHNALLTTTKSLKKIAEMNEVEMTTATKNKQQMKQLRRPSMKQLKRQSTRQLLMSQNVDDDGIFSQKYVPAHSSEDMINSRLTVLTK